MKLKSPVPIVDLKGWSPSDRDHCKGATSVPRIDRVLPADAVEVWYGSFASVNALTASKSDRNSPAGRSSTRVARRV